MWKMLQQKKPDDYVIATGKQYSIKQFINFTAKKTTYENYLEGVKASMRKLMMKVEIL